MQDLGTDCLLLCSNVGEFSADLDVIIKDLWDAAEMADKYDMRIAYEALGWGASSIRYRYVDLRNPHQLMHNVMENC